MTPPHGLAELVRDYGDPAQHVGLDGHLDATWQRHMILMPFPRPLPLAWDTRVGAKAARLHEAIAGEVGALFHDLDKAGLWDTLHTYGGAYADRPQRGDHAKRSVHAWGLALDFDPVRLARGVTARPVPPWVQIAEARGWRWGGRFHVPDPMHVQWCHGY